MQAPLQTQAYQKLVEWINAGKLKPGELYSELVVSRELKVSRTPIRTALQRLEADGLVVRLPQRGFYVYQFKKKDVEELFELRKALEGYAIEFICSNNERIDLKRFTRYMESQRRLIEKSTPDRYMREDFAFHQSLIKTTRNRRMVSLWNGLRQSMEVACLHLIVTKREDRRKLTEEHEDIVANIIEGDPVAAKEALFKHLDTAKDLLIESIGDSSG